jgi:hypothetical protein
VLSGICSRIDVVLVVSQSGYIQGCWSRDLVSVSRRPVETVFLAVSVLVSDRSVLVSASASVQSVSVLSWSRPTRSR